jgi:site-specific recombinase XerD
VHERTGNASGYLDNPGALEGHQLVQAIMVAPRAWELFLRAERIIDETGNILWQLADERADLELPNRFLRHLHNRSMSPNTVVAYARDLTHFFRFLNDGRVDVLDVGPAVIADFLDYLVRLPVRTAGKRQTLAAVTSDSNGPGRRRAATSINRTLAAVSSFFEFVITIEVYEADNPVRKVDDYALSRVPERHQPFMGKASRQRPVRRAMRVKTVRALPRPLAGADVEALLATLRTKRDRACCLLMLDGGLRPGEVLGIRIPEDLQYGQRRVHVAIVMIIPGVHGRSRVPTVSSTCTTRARSPRSATT